MKSLVFLGPGPKFDARQRFGKDKPEYIFWSSSAREALPGADVDLNGNVAPRGERGTARKVTDDEAMDLLTLPPQAGIDFRFAEAGNVVEVQPPLETAPAMPRTPEEIRAEVARELGDQQSQRSRRAGPKEE